MGLVGLRRLAASALWGLAFALSPDPPLIIDIAKTRKIDADYPDIDWSAMTDEQFGIDDGPLVPGMGKIVRYYNWEERGVLRGIKLPGSGFRRFPREEIERMRREMLQSYAPATELPEETRSGVKGTVVDGDML